MHEIHALLNFINEGFQWAVLLAVLFMSTENRRTVKNVFKTWNKRSNYE